MFIFLNISYSQTKFNANLKKELDSIYKIDQIFREYIDNSTTQQRKLEIAREYKKRDLNNIWGIIKEVDSLNLKRIEQLIKQHGYVGKTLVGEPTNEAMWYVIQHSDKIEKYFRLIKEAGRKNEIPKTLVAKMEDRLLVSKGKEQKYGTQAAGRLIKNADPSKDQYFLYIIPIKNPDGVNKRRKEKGFDTTIEENAKNFGIIYKEYTYKDLEKIFNK